MRTIGKSTGLIMTMMFMLSCSRYIPAPASSREVPGATQSMKPGNMENSILAEINSYRRSLSLSPLQVSDAATVQAYQHSKNMALGNAAFGHDGFSQRVAAISQAIGRISASGENVAYGALSAKGVVDVWLNSPPHRKNIEGNYTISGIGVFDRQGTLYFTQIFLRQ